METDRSSFRFSLRSFSCQSVPFGTSGWIPIQDCGGAAGSSANEDDLNLSGFSGSKSCLFPGRLKP